MSAFQGYLGEYSLKTRVKWINPQFRFLQKVEDCRANMLILLSVLYWFDVEVAEEIKFPMLVIFDTQVKPKNS